MKVKIYNTSNKWRFQLLELTCFIFMMCMNLNYLLGLSQLNSNGKSILAENVLAIIGIAFCFLHSLSITGRHYRLSEFLSIILSLFIGIFAFRKSGAMTFLKLILFWLGCRGIEGKKLLKYEIWSLLFSTGVIILSSLLGITSMRYRGDIMLFSFGFKNPNNLPAVVTCILFSYCLIKGETLSFKNIAVQIMITLLMYRFTGSRSPTAVLLLFYSMLLLCYFPFYRKVAEHMLRFLPVCFLLLAVISFLLGSLYDHSNMIWRTVNSFMSWRPYLWNKYIVVSGLSLFGQKLEEMGTLDNAYLVLLLRYGLIIFAVYVILFWHLSIIARRENNVLLGLAVLCYDFYFCGEFTPLLVNVNPLILIALSSISILEGRQEPRIEKPSDE